MVKILKIKNKNLKKSVSLKKTAKKITTKKKKVVKKTKPKKLNSKNRIKPVKKVKSTKKTKITKKKLKPSKKLKSKRTNSDKKSKETLVKLERHFHNPIIKPSFYPWESQATFNPTAFESNGKVHIIYRAIGEGDSSAFGYASSYDGLNIEDRPTYAVYNRGFFKVDKSVPSIDYVSGGGWSGGCEDPRITLLKDTIYMLYTAFDGWGSVRIAMTSISLSDFKKKKWNWEKPVLISPPGQINKNWVIFPEKINGKFAILHSISPDISIEYIDDLKEFDGKKFIKSEHNGKAPWSDSWDNMVRGVGPAPIKTDLGWLTLYHSMDRNDPDRYKLGAMILDYKNPNKILYRSAHPILEPEEYYENNGHKWGVVYSCGAVVKDDTLFVYYGGSDKFVCVASIEIKELLNSLKKNKSLKLKNNKILK